MPTSALSRTCFAVTGIVCVSLFSACVPKPTHTVAVTTSDGSTSAVAPTKRKLFNLGKPKVTEETRPFVPLVARGFNKSYESSDLLAAFKTHRDDVRREYQGKRLLVHGSAQHVPRLRLEDITPQKAYIELGEDSRSTIRVEYREPATVLTIRPLFNLFIEGEIDASGSTLVLRDSLPKN